MRFFQIPTGRDAIAKAEFCQKLVNLFLKRPDLYFFPSVDLDRRLTLGNVENYNLG